MRAGSALPSRLQCTSPPLLTALTARSHDRATHPKLMVASLCAVAAHGPHTDLAVGVTGVEGGAVSGPGDGGAVGHGGLLAHGRELGAQLVHDGLALQVPDLDARLGGGAEPVAVGGEGEGGDEVPGIQAVQALALRKVPQHCHVVLAARGAQGAIGGDRHGVDVPRVAPQVRLQLAVRQVPHLDELVPAGGHNDGVGGDGGEPHAADPLSVAVLLTDGVLALAQRVPQLDRLVTAARHDLTVVSGEGDREDVLGVSDEAAGGVAGVQVPQPQSCVPAARQRELAV
mmetsp:Transcript_713/g.2117  ORF Transcript_713/g.2117 Transcript_713/m.2117 type:complete len:286 (-) Transcript_713:298-1155(-)